MHELKGKILQILGCQGEFVRSQGGNSCSELLMKFTHLFERSLRELAVCDDSGEKYCLPAQYVGHIGISLKRNGARIMAKCHCNGTIDQSILQSEIYIIPDVDTNSIDLQLVMLVFYAGERRSGRDVVADENAPTFVFFLS